MDTLGPRIMVNVGTQAVSNTGLNPRDLAPLTNDAFLATFMGKTSLSESNGTSRPHNNFRQSYATQMDRVTLRSKSRPLTSNGDSIEPDSAILSIIRGNGSDSQQQQQQHQLSQRQLQGNRNRRRSFNQQQQQQQLLGGWNDTPCSPNYRPTHDSNRRRRTRSGGAHQQQISVVDQMAAQPHIPYAILPKRFEPKQALGNGLHQQSQQQQHSRSLNNTNLQAGNRRRRPAAPRRSQRQQEYYDDQYEDEQEDDLYLESLQPNIRRPLNRRPNRAYGQAAAYYGPRPRFENYYDSYSYGPMMRQGQLPLRPRRRMMYQDDGYVPFDIVPSYDLNEWQGPYARTKQALYSQQPRGAYRNGRNDNGFIRDDHRQNGSSRQSRHGNKPLTPTRNGKQSKSPRSKGQQKRRTSRQRKQRNQNSNTEGTPLTNSNETTDEEKQKRETTTKTETELNPLAPRDHENKGSDGEHKSE